MYKTVNEMLGDIVKVTPTSKVVGDMAIFMVQNDLTVNNIYKKAEDMSFPDSVVSYFQGMMGQPMGGFPERLQNLVLKGIEPITCRPGELLEAENFEEIEKYLSDKYDKKPETKDILSFALYPKVYEDYLKNIEEYGEFTRMTSDIFFHGLREGETGEVEVEEGKILVVKLLEIGKLDEEGYRTLFFEVNDSRRAIEIFDRTSNIKKETSFTPMVDPENKLEIGSNIPGLVTKILVKSGDKVKEKQLVAIVEAMKMESQITSTIGGTVALVAAKEGENIVPGELLIKLEN